MRASGLVEEVADGLNVRQTSHSDQSLVLRTHDSVSESAEAGVDSRSGGLDHGYSQCRDGAYDESGELPPGLSVLALPFMLSLWTLVSSDLRLYTALIGGTHLR